MSHWHLQMPPVPYSALNRLGASLGTSCTRGIGGSLQTHPCREGPCTKRQALRKNPSERWMSLAGSSQQIMTFPSTVPNGR